ncbi:MAG: heavy metal translocating P-type ATPase [Zoogloeaceae bacterium]|jgi:heavy metal translocating P-type ATPase|nr:heavy metal translocating P-type ATPase [Zoogloeaceae bacterium]
MSPGWFSALETAHELPGRVRFRYASPYREPDEHAGLARQIAGLPGVAAQRFNPRARALVVRFDPERTDAARLREALLTLTPQPLPSRSPVSPARPYPRETPTVRRENVGGSFAVLLLSGLLPPALRFLATTGTALPVLRQGVRDFRANGVTSHVLEALAVGISLMRQDTLSANATIFMLELGEYLEESIARQSDALLKHLLNPIDKEVWVERDGNEIAIPADDVKIGDTVIVGAGVVIPVDGAVLSGEAMVNEAAMTGESAPVEKSRGCAALSGTHVEEGRLRIYAEQVGTHTAVARIADYVEQSLNAKSVTQLEAARLADRLVPLVLMLAGASYLVSADWQRAAAVLQADYACALKLATPVAFKSAMYQAGKNGILVKGADALERLAQADTFVFDKTGTLTSGTLTVTDSIVFDASYSAEDLICLAASVEEHYFHPMAMAVVKAARSTSGQHFRHKEVEFVVAHGVASTIEGKRIVVGSRHFVEDDEGIDVTPYRGTVDQLHRDGKTLLYIGFGGRLLGVLALKDTLRAESAATIARLRTLGVRKIVMLTGDHADRAAEFAAQLDIDEYHAELLPEHKATIIQRLKNESARIAFVGDGINDAPALAGAHVGIAMQKGADVARLTADIALLEDDITRVADAKALAIAAMQRISTNYRLTVGLNTAILSAAAFGILTPIATSVLHNGSTIGILLNALRIRSGEKEKPRRKPRARKTPA